MASPIGREFNSDADDATLAGAVATKAATDAALATLSGKTGTFEAATAEALQHAQSTGPFVGSESGDSFDNGAQGFSQLATGSADAAETAQAAAEAAQAAAETAATTATDLVDGAASDLAQLEGRVDDLEASGGTGLTATQYAALDQLWEDAYGPGSTFPRATAPTGSRPTGDILGVNASGDPTVILTLDFTDADGDGTDVLVDWGDGSSETAAFDGDPSHTYTTNGTFTITATPRDAVGSGTPQSEQVTIGSAGSTPDVTVSDADLAGDATPDHTTNGLPTTANGTWAGTIEPSTDTSAATITFRGDGSNGTFLQLLLDVNNGSRRLRLREKITAGSTATRFTHVADATNGGAGPTDYEFDDSPEWSLELDGSTVTFTFDGETPVTFTQDGDTTEREWEVVANTDPSVFGAFTHTE